MKRHKALSLVVWSLTTASGCSIEHALWLAPPPACNAALASQVALAVGAYASFDPASNGGCVTFPANLSITNAAEYLVVAQSTGGAPGTVAGFNLRSVTPSPAAVAPAATTVRPGHSSTATAFDRGLRELGRTRAAAARTAVARAPARAAGIAAVTPPTVGSLRSFVVCDTLDCSRFKTVSAQAQAVGAHVAIYVDIAAPANGLSPADIATLQQVFDARLFPLARDSFGAVSDLDTNGVVIALMTPVVNSLVTKAQCDTAGFVAGFFFPPDLDLSAPASQSNHGEIFYSFVADPAGTLSCAHSVASVKLQTPVTFVHELQHMINYAQHVVFLGGLSSEEGWLDEGLSKYTEELAGRSYLPANPVTFHTYLDFGDLYDASQYLRAPDHAFLLIPFDNGTLADVGASWLFVRYLMDQYGSALSRKLAQTRLTGAANVAAQTGQNVATLLERWGLANWVSDLPGFAAPAELRYTSWQFRATFDSLYAQYPGRFTPSYPLVPVAVAGTQVNISGGLHTGSAVYARALQGPGGAGFTLFLSGVNGVVPSVIVPRLDAVAARLDVIRIQ